LIEKEFDEDGSVNGASGIQAYHFGARVYDPEVGLWMAKDAAGQYFSPYGYTTNPINVIDPDGNFALQSAVVSAIIGAAIGTVQGIINAHNNNGSWYDYIAETLFWSNVHGAIGFGAGGVGGGISSNIASGVEGIGGAILAGTVSGVVTGAMSYTGNYIAEYAYSGFYDGELDDSYLDGERYLTGLGKSAAIGGAVGAACGALAELLPEGEVNLTTEKEPPYSHSVLEGEHNGKAFKISVGPDERRHFFNDVAGDANRPTHSSDGHGWTMKVSRVNTAKLSAYAEELQQQMRDGTLRWDIDKYSCVSYASSALRRAGAASAGISAHPYWLHVKMMLREGLLQLVGQ